MRPAGGATGEPAMLPGHFGSRGGNKPLPRLTYSRRPSDFPPLYRGFSAPPDDELVDQPDLSNQTPYERRASLNGHHDTGLLLGQTDFKASLTQPFAIKFASRKSRSDELRPAQSREEPPRSKIKRFFRWNTKQSGKKSSGMPERVEAPPSEPPPSGAANHGSD